MANKEAKHCYNAKEQYLPFLKVKSGYYQKDDPENGYPGENEIKDPPYVEDKAGFLLITGDGKEIIT